MFKKDYLVGGWATSLKNMKVNWDDYSQYFWENKIDGNHTTNQLSNGGFHRLHVWYIYLHLGDLQGHTWSILGGFLGVADSPSHHPFSQDFP